MAENNEIEMKRFSIDMPEKWHTYLSNLAKTYKVTQGEVIQALLDNPNDKMLGVRMVEIRNAKVERRGKNKEAFKAFKAQQAAAAVQS